MSCRECGDEACKLPFTVATPCQKRFTVHMLRLFICAKSECIEMLNRRVLVASVQRNGLVVNMGRTNTTTPPRDLVNGVYERDATRKCAQCGVDSWRMCGDVAWSNNACGRCFRVWYCGRECQSKHWSSVHRSQCVVGIHDKADNMTLRTECAKIRATHNPLTANYAVSMAHNKHGFCAREACPMRSDDQSPLQAYMVVAVKSSNATEQNTTLVFCCEACRAECTAGLFDQKIYNIVSDAQFSVLAPTPSG